MTTYTVKASRSDGWWALSVPEIPGVYTQVRKLSAAGAMARDAIAMMLDVSPSSFEVHLEPELNAEISTLLEESKALARQAEELRDRAASSTRKSVQLLLEAGLTQAEAAAVLDVSPQRLSQLAPHKPKGRIRGEGVDDAKAGRLLARDVKAAAASGRMAKSGKVVASGMSHTSKAAATSRRVVTSGKVAAVKRSGSGTEAKAKR